MMKPENLNNSILYNYKIVNGGASALPIVDSIYKRLNIGGYLENIKRQALNNILANLIIAYCNNKFVAVSKNSKDYSFPKRFYGMEHYTYNIMIPLINSLIENEYIQEAPGFYDSETGKGKRTRIWATLKLLEMFLQAVPIQKLQ